MSARETLSTHAMRGIWIALTLCVPFWAGVAALIWWLT